MTLLSISKGFKSFFLLKDFFFFLKKDRHERKPLMLNRLIFVNESNQFSMKKELHHSVCIYGQMSLLISD